MISSHNKTIGRKTVQMTGMYVGLLQISVLGEKGDHQELGYF